MIDEFIHKFSHLRTDKDHKRWSALTMHQAPHKPFLLMLSEIKAPFGG
jgi:hypothetical protein